MSQSIVWKVAGMALIFLLVTTLGTSAQIFSNMITFQGDNGKNPYAPLIQASDGNFYGTTLYGGVSNKGTAFKMTRSGAITVLWHFTGSCEGANPYAPLLQARNGSFYGTTYNGGSNGLGAVFKIAPNGAVSCVHSFNGLIDGAHPVGSLIQARDGALYGTTEEGGPWNKGTVFRITMTGTLTTLYRFHGFDGSGPEAALVQGADDQFYGTTWDGGLVNKGTVFRITSSGRLNTLHNFGASVSDGAYPYAPLVFGASGILYGTTEQGGALNRGTAFRITPSGMFAVLHSFNGADGADPEGSLLLASDGKLYGTTVWGGSYGQGTIFQMPPSGNVITLHSFDYTNGAHPIGGLIQDVGGSFYGTSAWGTPLNTGTIFRMSPMP